MRNLMLAFRSLFKKGRHNPTKIVSLGAGLAVALLLVSKVYFERSYDTFYPDRERIYRLMMSYSINGEPGGVHSYVPGAVAPAMKEEIPGVEAATRLNPIFSGNIITFTTPDKKRYSVGTLTYMADTCLFDVLPRPILSGDPKQVFARPGYAMISRSLAETLGGIDRVEGLVLTPDPDPTMKLIVGGVFEDVPENSHLRYNLLVSLEGWPLWSRTNWVSNERYAGYVRLASGVGPEDLKQAIREMQLRHIDPEEMRKAGIELEFSMKPMSELHAGSEDVRNASLMLAILAFALLFTAVMNYILIAVSSIVARTREVALHKSYGASRSEIRNMMMTETFVHMLLALMLAVLLIFLCRDVVRDLLNVSVPTLLFSKGALVLLGVCVLVFLIAGLVPATLFARIPVASVFRNYHENKRIWKLGLLFLQFIAAGLLLSLLIVIGKQHRFMLHSDSGYAYERLAYCDASGVDSVSRALILNEIGKFPEIERVSSCQEIPFKGASGNMIIPMGSERECFNAADLYGAGSDYLELMEVPLVDGRFFTEASSEEEVMVSRSFAERMRQFDEWAEGPVIGLQIDITEHGPHTICGVYEDFRIGSLVGLDSRPSMLFYNKAPSSFLLFKFREVNPSAVEKVNRKLEELRPDSDLKLALWSSEIVELYSNTRKFRDQVLIGGIVTLFISLIGLIGYTNDEINRRSKELAIRKVNGARTGNILGLFLRDVLWIALPAVLSGCVGAYFVSEHWMRQFAAKIELTPLLFLAGGVSVVVIVISCVVYRTWKVANDNPVNSLKSE